MSLSFDDCGLAKAAPIDGIYREHFDDWLKNGYNAQMQWIEKNIEIRFNPALLLENAKTAIVVLQSYKITPKETPNGKIARCKSLEEDYHLTIKSKLKILSEKIAEFLPTAKFRPCVDSAPILEKYWAQKAGLGTIGKNTLFISDKIGSFCNIGILLLDADIPIAAAPLPTKNFCDKCGKCIISCPTKALVSPYTIDCRKCISYQTIHKTEPDFDFHGWDLGCDICQEVCPRNLGKNNFLH